MNPALVSKRQPFLYMLQDRQLIPIRRAPAFNKFSISVYN